MMILLMFILGCADKEIQTEPATPIVQEPSASEPTSEPETPPEITNNEVGSSDLYPEEEAPYRNKKRMRIKHVQDSMVLVSGGIEWNVDNTDKWEEYSSTLGVPDYQFSVREDRSVSVMFHKFLDDAATHTCRAWIEEESTGTQRLFFSEIEPDEMDAAKIRQNMVALRRRFHGKEASLQAPIINSLIDLHYTTLQRTDSLTQAWTTVCVGLFSHPDFFMY